MERMAFRAARRARRMFWASSTDTSAKRTLSPARAVLGPQDDAFTQDGLRTFLTGAYTVTPEFDRMGCRLIGWPSRVGPRSPPVMAITQARSKRSFGPIIWAAA